jgi:hypothetical protein
MRIHHHIALISLVVPAFVMVAPGVNYIHRNAIVPSTNAMPAGSQSDTKAQATKIGEVGQQSEHERVSAPPSQASLLRNARPAADDNSLIRERKTLAMLLLMLKDGRGAR